MEILKMSAFTLIAVVIIVLIKQEKKEIGVIISIFVTVVLAVYSVIQLNDIVELLFNLISKAGVNTKYLEIIIKVVGIAYVVELTKDVCVDSGESSLGSKVEMCGKIIMVGMTIPIITGVVEVINKLI